MWWFEKRNKKIEDLKSSSNISVYLQNNAIVLFEVQKKL